jgi:uncharacterized metal-binding protein YceD (DUF177 family)
MSENSFPLKQVVTSHEVPEGGLELRIEATPDERLRLADYLDVPSVESMTAALSVTRWRGRGLAVRGTARARVTQSCVVTLDPVEGVIDEEVETYFAPDVAPRLSGPMPEAAEVPDIDVEPLINERVDIGALICEHLAIGLDPYPRKQGVDFQTGGDNGDEEEKSGAFAALASLRADRDKN